MRVAVGDPITYAYGERVVHAYVGRRDPPYNDDLAYRVLTHFMPYPVMHETATPVQQLDDFEYITWERGWTDGVALLAAHALFASR